jgi:hypothetical protein
VAHVQYFYEKDQLQSRLHDFMNSLIRSAQAMISSSSEMLLEKSMISSGEILLIGEVL